MLKVESENTELLGLIENASRSYVEHEKHKLMLELLQNVRLQGLGGNADEIRLRSYDKGVSDLFCVNVTKVAPGQGGQMFQMADYYAPLVHGAANGVWSILLERSVATPDSDRLEWDERLQASILFVLRAPEARKYQGGDRASSIPLFYSGQAGDITEIKTRQHFQLEDVLGIVVPKYLLKPTQQIFKGARCIVPVDNIIHQNTIPSHHEMPRKTGSMYLEGPDYIKGIKKVVAITQVKKFASHVMRLPTRRDMMRFYSDRLTSESCLAHCKTDDPNQALRRVTGTLCFREDIQYLASCGLDLEVNQQDSNPKGRQTPLHHAARLNKPAMIRALLALDARYDIQNAKGLTAQQYAAEHGLNLATIHLFETIAAEEKALFVARVKSDPENQEFLAMMGQVGEIGQHWSYQPGN